MGKDNYILAKTFPVENGVNRIMIRSTTTAGTITIKATADGLKGSDITLITKPFIQQDGLTTILPSAGLPSHLQRGPTPLTPSYKKLRNQLPLLKQQQEPIPTVVSQAMMIMN